MALNISQIVVILGGVVLRMHSQKNNFVATILTASRDWTLFWTRKKHRPETQIQPQSTAKSTATSRNAQDTGQRDLASSCAELAR